MFFFNKLRYFNFKEQKNIFDQWLQEILIRFMNWLESC